MEALLSGKYDLNRTANAMTQTGGGCRATNYVGFIRRALKKAGMEQIPVISLNLAGLESNPGFHLSASLLIRVAMAAECAVAVVPYLMFFLVYCFYNQFYNADKLGMSKKAARISSLGIWAIEHLLRGTMTKEFKKSVHFTPPVPIREIASFAEPIVSIGNQTGEGWFLTGEMVELIQEGVPNIVCAQPFGCLPNHVVGKGVIKALRKAYPASNIVAIDYDPGASEVNQLNRIKLMLSTAQKNLSE